MPPQSRLLREWTSSRLNVNSLPVKKTHVIHNWGDDKLQIIHESFIFNFFIVRLITKSNHYNEKSSGLSGVMLMVMLFGREGSTVRGILQEICMWCMMIAGVVYESSKSRWGFEFCDGMALSFATLNS